MNTNKQINKKKKKKGSCFIMLSHRSGYVRERERELISKISIDTFSQDARFPSAVADSKPSPPSEKHTYWPFSRHEARQRHSFAKKIILRNKIKNQRKIFECKVLLGLLDRSLVDRSGLWWHGLSRGVAVVSRSDVGHGVLRGEVDISLFAFGDRGDPRRVVAAELDVVVRELPVLVVVETDELGLLTGAEVQARDQVDQLGDDDRHDERVGGTGHDVGDLDVKLPVILVDESSRDLAVDAVEADDPVVGEEGVPHETNHAADRVFGEHVHGVVDADEHFHLGGKVADDAGDDAEGDGRPRGDEPGGWGGGNEAGDCAGAPADQGPLSRQAEVKQRPRHCGKGGSETRVPASNDGAEIGAEGGTTVEAEPPEPQQNGAEGDEGYVVGTEVHHHPLVAPPENQGVGHGRHTRNYLDWPASGIVEDAIVEGPAIGIPHPACDGAVDEGGPEEHEDHGGEHAAAFGNGASDESGGD